MAFFSGHTPSQLLYLNYHSINLISPQSAKPAYPYPIYSVPTVTVGKRWLSASAESTPSEFQGPNAYQLLGVSETSSFAEIKASFHKLAKETHPDVAKCDSISSAASKQFIQILAAYEVKHMNWYRIGDKVSVCECRCTRARLPPSKFWLFEPRCGTHDIGGWYVETFGRNKKGQTVPSQRYWDGLDTNHQFDKRLHPAMYLLTLAYRTLDIEDARQKRKALKDIIEAKMFRLLSWCKRFV